MACSLHKGAQEAATKLASEAVRAPSDSRAWFVKRLTSQIAGNVSSATAEFSKAVELNPADYEARMSRAWLALGDRGGGGGTIKMAGVNHPDLSASIILSGATGRWWLGCAALQSDRPQGLRDAGTRLGAAGELLWLPASALTRLRTTNIVESPFSAVRLRTDAARRFKKTESAEAMIRKLLRVAEQFWRKLNAPELMREVYDGKRFKDGIAVDTRAEPTRKAAWIFLHT
jgi:hypothetical protein